MHALLLVGTNKKEIEERIRKEAKDTSSRVIYYPSQKISDVKEIASFTRLSRNEPILIVCEDVNTASLEALNAFLKILEDPGENISFALTAENTNQVLPTIVSRCRVIKIGNKDLSEKTADKVERFLKSPSQKRLHMLEKIKTREQALSLVQSTMSYTHTNLKENPKINSQILEECQITLDRLKTNANVKLQILNFGMRLPSP